VAADRSGAATPVPRLPVEPVRPGDSAARLARAEAGAPSPVTRGGISLGAPFGVPLRVSVLGLVVATVLAATTLGQEATDAGLDQGQTLALILAGGLLLEVSVLVHEIAHCIAARALGLRVGGLKLWALGGLTEVQTEAESPRREYAIAVVGPLASIVLAGLAGVAALSVGATTSEPAGLLLFWVAVVNGLLAAFNLLPGLPLDGGRVLRAAVWGATGRETTGTRVAAIVGFVVAGVTLAVGLLSPGAGSVASGGFLTIFVAVYVALNAQAALRRAAVSERAPGLSAGRLARRALTAPADLPLGEAMRRAGLLGATAVVVTAGDGSPQSLVSGAKVDSTPVERRPWVSVSSVASPITEGLVLDARLVGQGVLDALRTHPASEYLVVDPVGAVLGVLAAVDVVAAVDPGRLRQLRQLRGPKGRSR